MNSIPETIILAHQNACAVLECRIGENAAWHNDPYSFNDVLTAVGRWVCMNTHYRAELDESLKQFIKDSIGNSYSGFPSLWSDADFEPQTMVSKALSAALTQDKSCQKKLFETLAILEQFDPTFSSTGLFDSDEEESSATTDTVIRLEGLAAAKEPSGFVPKVIEGGQKDEQSIKWLEFCETVALSLFNLRINTAFAAIGLESLAHFCNSEASEITFDAVSNTQIEKWDAALTEMFAALGQELPRVQGKMMEALADEKCDPTHKAFGNWLDWTGAAKKLRIPE